jgi:hypothetical protein
MKEAKIELKEQEYKGNKQYIIIDKSLKAMEDGDYIIVEKIFAESKGYPGKISKKDKDGKDTDEKSLIFPCKVKYDDKEVTLWTYEVGQPSYKDFSECGGAMDKIKITAHEKKYLDKKNSKKIMTTFTFELIDQEE